MNSNRGIRGKSTTGGLHALVMELVEGDDHLDFGLAKAMEAHILRALGVYEITVQIGEGGMGTVYRATDTSLSRQVAIKALPDAFAELTARWCGWTSISARTCRCPLSAPSDAASPSLCQGEHTANARATVC